METAPLTPQVPINPLLSLKLSDEDRMALLKKISTHVNKKSFRTPRKACKNCFGRGFRGYLNGIKNLPVPCKCTFIKKR